MKSTYQIGDSRTPDWLDPDKPPYFLIVGLGTILTFLALSFLSGCSSIDKLPPGTQVQSSTFGLKVAPQAPDGTPLTLGSHSLIITTEQSENAGPNLNRFQGRAPGVEIRSTVATGPVGEQLREAGGPEALRQLLQDRTGSDSSPVTETRLDSTEPVP